MRYLDAYGDFFKSRVWLTNLLLGGVCILIPAVGVIVYMGYLEGVVRWQVWTPRARGGAAPVAQRPGPPDFVFNRFIEYLTRGVWPFVASLVVQLAFLPLMLLAAAPLFAAGITNADGPALALLILIAAAVYLVTLLAMTLVVAPVTLRAMLAQDFVSAFNVAFARDFIRRMWKEQLLVFGFLMVTGLPLGLLGYAACFVGVYPAMALLIFANWHLNAQLYRLYLSRGGEAVPMPPTLPRCDFCGYDLRGTPGPACPECGGPRPAPLRPV